MFIIRMKQLVLHHVFLSGTRSLIDRSFYSGGRPNRYEEWTSWLFTGYPIGRSKLS
ncbi:hypothetical protein [Sporosarcina globispora]|uniref:hypothetical protein n=1 Tax=Sporosarcina globispora TaxID=1459 RepID=UPI001F275296|nr:hypothetical protein [Sporosarcina globispora]